MCTVVKITNLTNITIISFNLQYELQSREMQQINKLYGFCLPIKMEIS